MKAKIIKVYDGGEYSLEFLETRLTDVEIQRIEKILKKVVDKDNCAIKLTPNGIASNIWILHDDEETEVSDIDSW